MRPMLSPGARLAQYEILGPLGAGGMGEVYRARDTRLGRQVALKVLRPDRIDEGRRRRFLPDARAAAAFNHSNIVTIHEVGSVEGTDFIVMEFVEGKTLDSLIRPGLALDQALSIAVAVADALSGAHARGIVHSDLKPLNVIVSEGGAVKVLDFGLATLVEAPQPAPADARLRRMRIP